MSIPLGFTSTIEIDEDEVTTGQESRACPKCGGVGSWDCLYVPSHPGSIVTDEGDLVEGTVLDAVRFVCMNCGFAIFEDCSDETEPEG